MCLLVEKKSPKVKARVDKVCYKHLIVVKNELLTPYKRAEIEIGCTYTSRLMKYGERRYYVDLGLHSFNDLNACIKDATAEYNLNRHYYTSPSYRHVIAKCIIPKGSYYYVGNFDDSKSFASDAIKYLEILDIKI